MATEAAHLFVTVSADVDQATRGLNSVNTATQKTDGFLKGAAKQAIGFGSAMIGLNAGAAIFGAVKDGAIGMNAELETSTLQFTTLMGDADKAKKHVEGLFDFAAKTPFETGPIIEASRLMETFGGSALNTKENLTSFGDAAAATGQPINEVAFWMSRAYAAIQAGKPWGEAAQRLGEMGVMTPQVRQKLEDLQATGASGSEVWAGMTGSLDKFGGAMEKQAGTFDGMMSTLSDGINMFLAKALFPLFEGLKGLVGGLNEVMASPGFNGALEAAAAGLTVVFDGIGKAIGMIASVVGPMIGWIIEFDKALLGLAGGAGDLSTVLGGLTDTILVALQGAFDWVVNEGVPMAANALAQVAEKFIAWVGPAAEQLAAALPVVAGKIIDFIAKNLPVWISKLAEWGAAFVGWVAKNVLPKLPGVLATVAGAIIGWIAKTAPVVAGRMLAMGGQMLANFGKLLPQLPAKIGQFLGAVAGMIVKHAPGIILKVGKMALDLVNAFVKFSLSLPQKIGGLFLKIVGALPGIGIQLAKGALGAAGDFIRGFINGMADLPGKIFAKIKSAFRGIHIDIGPFHISASGVSIDIPKINLPSFAVGAWNLPRDTIAQVHKGEMIVPADVAERLRGGRGFSGPGETTPGRSGNGVTQYITLIVEGDYVGTDDHMDRLLAGVGTAVRAVTPRRTAIVGSR